MKLKAIQILEKNGAYCVRYKVARFWRYDDIDGYGLTPNFWMSKERAERCYQELIDLHRKEENDKNSSINIVKFENFM